LVGMKQLPKQFQVRAATRGKKPWRQAEMLLAISFLKTAGLVETSTKKGTFIRDSTHTINDLIVLAKKVHMPTKGIARVKVAADFKDTEINENEDFDGMEVESEVLARLNE
jgi:hypothetical protein